MRIPFRRTVLTLSLAQAASSAFAQPPAARGLTAVAGIKVGHYTLAERPTGCTVVLAEAGAVAGVDVRGGAPGTRETDLLNPVNMVQKVHAIVLAGGSAFGLDAAGGVMRYLEEKGIGFDAFVAKVPIVPAAILFDLGVGNPKIRPTAECGYAAAQAATDAPVTEGNVGAGAGATVGKLGGPARSMKAGVGSAAIALPNGLVVAALVAVNAVGDVIDPATGRVVAGVRDADGKGLADARRLIRSGALGRREPDVKKPGAEAPPRPGENTTIGVVATNARLSKPEAAKFASLGMLGFARALSPPHTAFDGDTLFALSVGDRPADLTRLGLVAADAVARAIVRGVRAATSLAGLPAARDL